MESGDLYRSEKKNLRDTHSFDYNRFLHTKTQKRKKGNPRTKKKMKFKDVVTAFDIETTALESDQAAMYIWQWCFYYGPDDYEVVIGRTWDEFLEFTDKLCTLLTGDDKLIVYDHNLSYEFQFFRGIYNFVPEEVFCMKSRKVLTCTMFDKIFFRCSYIQTNMNLETFTKKFHVKHQKLSGELDYTKKRYFYTELSDSEMAYCINDVIGLCEAIQAEMESDDDNLYSIPLTSTGYVRRDAKRAMKGLRVSDILPDIDLYKRLREAFRGGNTHANRYYAGVKISNQVIHSADRSSSYPAVQCCNLYPITKFFHVSDDKRTWDYMMSLITDRHRAVLATISLTDVELRNPYWGCPYIPVSKCRNLYDAVEDNGRVLSAKYLEITVIDVDLKIIIDEYKFTAEVVDLYHSRYGRLPQRLVDCTIGYYKSKTELKGNPAMDVLYMKSKNKLNSIYGMMAQNPVKPEILFNYNDSDDYTLDTEKTDEELLNDYNSRAFLCYQWGVWVTAWARFRLEEGIKIVGPGFLYCDTDSVKYIGTADFTGYNNERIKECEQAGCYAVDSKGVTHYMGVFEQESDMQEFKTLGAKKYVYRDLRGELHSTIAGVSKKQGATELEKHGGIDAFREGFIFTEAGGLEAVYNDRPEVTEYITEDGIRIPITSNVCLKKSTYQIGLTADYRRLINSCTMEEIDL